ncbi:hypothetical protein Hanom_Chr12g01102941 [Helianthus anomalus]
MYLFIYYFLCYLKLTLLIHHNKNCQRHKNIEMYSQYMTSILYSQPCSKKHMV